jgi:endonuclease YncB( thermonuclease family)
MIRRIGFIAALLLACSTHAEVLTGRVVGIADGDTITILDSSRQQHKIRLAGIDAPEKKQAFGERSRQNLAAMIFRKTVIVEWEKQDRYGRTIGKVMVNGVDANLAQVKAGMAWWYEKYRKEQSPADERMYAEAEQQARTARVGLWRDPVPVAPWEWRSAQRSR